MKKKILTVTILILVSWELLSLIGYLNQHGIYKQYMVDADTTPYFTLVLRGLHDGIYPWSKPDTTASDSIETNAGSSTQATTKDTSTDQTFSSSEDVTSQNSTSGSQTTSFVPVDQSYFKDALFIGDSRTDGLHIYGGIKHATFYANTGMTIYDLWKKSFCEYKGQKLALAEALTKQSFKKIYIQLGINEMGRGNIEDYINEYELTLEKLKALQPDAIIFIEGVIKVTKEKSDTDPVFQNSKLEEMNQRLSELADNDTIFYIDENEVLCDSDGNLRSDYSFDQVHLYGKYYGLWTDYLLSKGIQR